MANRGPIFAFNSLAGKQFDMIARNHGLNRRVRLVKKCSNLECIANMGMFSEKTAILWRLGLILVAGFLTTSIAGYVVSRDTVRRGIVEQALPLTGDNIYSEIQKDILLPVFISSMMAHDTFLRDWILDGERDPAQIDHYLKEVKAKYGAITSFLVSERTRKHYTAQGMLPPVREDAFRDKWYFRVRQMKAPYETNVDPDLATRDTMTIFINYRVMDYHGNFIGTTGVGLALDTVKKIIDSYRERFRREIYFVDTQGMIVLTGQSMSQVQGSIRTQPGISDVADAMLNRSATPTQLEYRLGGAVSLINSRFIPELGWYLVVEERGSENITAITRILEVNLAISAAVTLLVLVLALLALNRYQKRLEKMTETAVSSAAAETKLAREQQRFVSMVSHEFRTPLATIDTSLHSLRRLVKDMPEEVLSRHRKIGRACQRLQALIGNFLTEDRLKQPDAIHRMEKVDIYGLLARIAWRVEWPEMIVNADGLPSAITGDHELLGIAFSNLIDNAVKYSPHGGKIRIDGSTKDGYAEIQVADSGIGVKPEDLPHIFDKYFRAEGSTVSGSGLGLFIVRQIVELHGGTVSAHSVFGEGLTVSIRLPLEGENHLP